MSCEYDGLKWVMGFDSNENFDNVIKEKPYTIFKTLGNLRIRLLRFSACLLLQLQLQLNATSACRRRGSNHTAPAADDIGLGFHFGGMHLHHGTGSTTSQATVTVGIAAIGADIAAAGSVGSAATTRTMAGIGLQFRIAFGATLFISSQPLSALLVEFLAHPGYHFGAAIKCVSWDLHGISFFAEIFHFVEIQIQ